MKNFTKQNIEEIAYYIWEEDKQKSPKVCWHEALDTIDWNALLLNHIVSEDFVKEFFFKNYELEGMPRNLLTEQRWSVEFIKEFIDKYCLYNKSNKSMVALEQIFGNQKLPEWFLIKYADCFSPKLYSFWPNIIPNHQLSEDLLNKIVENEPGLFEIICRSQHLTAQFIEKHKKQFTINLWNIIFYYQPKTEYLFNLYKEIHLIKNEPNCRVYPNCCDIPAAEIENWWQHPSKDQKQAEMQKYAQDNNLTFDGEYLYAYRFHDKLGRGVYNKTNYYDELKYYRDWHCDLNSFLPNSFGLGIYPETFINHPWGRSGTTQSTLETRQKCNVKVKVHVDDWGCAVDNSQKARVWGFTIIEFLDN